MEAKFQVTEVDQIEARVISEGGIFQFSRFETNVFFDRRGDKLNKKGEVLRLRSEEYIGGKSLVVMTFKGQRKRGKLKCRDEHETIVGSFQDAEAILKSLGYRETFRFEKLRRKFLLGNCSVEIDELPWLGHFCEVEGKTEVAIHRVLKKIGCDDVKLITDGYGSLIKKYAQQNNRNAKKVTF